MSFDGLRYALNTKVNYESVKKSESEKEMKTVMKKIISEIFGENHPMNVFANNNAFRTVRELGLKLLERFNINSITDENMEHVEDILKGNNLITSRGRFIYKPKEGCFDYFTSLEENKGFLSRYIEVFYIFSIVKDEKGNNIFKVYRKIDNNGNGFFIVEDYYNKAGVQIEKRVIRILNSSTKAYILKRPDISKDNLQGFYTLSCTKYLEGVVFNEEEDIVEFPDTETESINVRIAETDDPLSIPVLKKLQTDNIESLDNKTIIKRLEAYCKGNQNDKEDIINILKTMGVFQYSR